MILFMKSSLSEAIKKFNKVEMLSMSTTNEYFDEFKGPMVRVETLDGWFYGDKKTAQTLLSLS